VAFVKWRGLWRLGQIVGRGLRGGLRLGRWRFGHVENGGDDAGEGAWASRAAERGKIQNFKFQISNFRSQILDFKFQISISNFKQADHATFKATGWKPVLLCLQQHAPLGGLDEAAVDFEEARIIGGGNDGGEQADGFGDFQDGASVGVFRGFGLNGHGAAIGGAVPVDIFGGG